MLVAEAKKKTQHSHSGTLCDTQLTFANSKYLSEKKMQKEEKWETIFHVLRTHCQWNGMFQEWGKNKSAQKPNAPKHSTAKSITENT